MTQENATGRNFLARMATIVTVICLIIGACVTVKSCCQVATAGAQMIISLGDQDYDLGEQTGGTLLMLFQGIPPVARAIVWGLVVMLIPGIPFLVSMFVIDAIRRE